MSVGAGTLGAQGASKPCVHLSPPLPCLCPFVTLYVTWPVAVAFWHIMLSGRQTLQHVSKTGRSRARYPSWLVSPQATAAQWVFCSALETDGP